MAGTQYHHHAQVKGAGVEPLILYPGATVYASLMLRCPARRFAVAVSSARTLGPQSDLLCPH
jgi:hypothetical protein